MDSLLIFLLLFIFLNQVPLEPLPDYKFKLQEPVIPDRTLATVLAWSPDGKYLAVGTNHGIRLLNAQFTGIDYLNSGWVYALMWSHDSQYLAVASQTDDDCSLQIWRPQSHEIIWTAPYCQLGSLHWNQNSNWLAFSHTFGQLHVVYLHSPEDPYRVAMNVSNYEWHPENDWLAFTAQDQTIVIYDISLQTIIWKEDQAVQYVTWSPDGDRLAAVIKAGSKSLPMVNEAGAYAMTWPQWHGIHVWNLHDNTLENALEITDNATLLGRLHWLADGHIGSYYDRIRNEVFMMDVVQSWDLSTGTRSASYRLGGGSSSGGNVTWSPDRRRVAAETIWQGCATNIFQPVPPANLEQPRIAGCGATWTPDSRYVTTIIEQGLQHYDLLTHTVVEYPLSDLWIECGVNHSQKHDYLWKRLDFKKRDSANNQRFNEDCGKLIEYRREISHILSDTNR